MGSSAPAVINHLPGRQGIVISHPSVQLVLHPRTTAASQPTAPLDQPRVQEGGSGQRPWREGASMACWESGLEPHAECGWCCEALKYRDSGGKSRENGRYLLSECFLLKQALKRFRTTVKHLITAAILSNVRQLCVNCL